MFYLVLCDLKESCSKIKESNEKKEILSMTSDIVGSRNTSINSLPLFLSSSTLTRLESAILHQYVVAGKNTMKNLE